MASDTEGHVRGIEEVTVYLPGARLAEPLGTALGAPSGIPLTAPDEDPVTLAWQAISALRPGTATDAVQVRAPAGDIEPRGVIAHLSATGLVNPDVPVAALAPEAGSTDLLRLVPHTGSCLTALVDHGVAHRSTPPSAELAVAWRTGAPDAVEVLAEASRTGLSFDRWQATERDGPGDPRFVEETLLRRDATGLLERLLKQGGVAPGDLTGVAVSATVPVRAATWAREWGVDTVWAAATPEYAPGRHAARTFAEAVTWLADAGPGAVVAVLEMGWGGQGVLLRAGPSVRTAVTVVSRAAGLEIGLDRWLADADVEAGAASGNDTLWTSPAKLRREMPALLGLVGTRCAGCATVAFPPRLTCEECGGTELRRQPLSRTGTVVSHNIDRLFAAPYSDVQMVVLDLDGGGRFFGQLVADAPRFAQVGDRARLALRRLHSGSGLPHYFWKVDLDDPT